MIFKVNKTTDYTVVSNIHLKDSRLSLKAKGLLTLMLSLPDDWNYSIKGLTSICIESELAITTALNELKKAGYVMVRKILPNESKSKKIEYEYNIYETPQEQGLENQGLENQGLENQGQLNTKESNTKKLYKDIVDYLNASISAHYKYQSVITQKHINARVREGYTMADFKTVIDKKVSEWKGTEMAKYLRPETLFGSKFESYLNAPQKTVKTANTHFENERHYTKAELDSLITNIDDIDF